MRNYLGILNRSLKNLSVSELVLFYVAEISWILISNVAQGISSKQSSSFVCKKRLTNKWIVLCFGWIVKEYWATHSFASLWIWIVPFVLRIMDREWPGISNSLLKKNYAKSVTIAISTFKLTGKCIILKLQMQDAKFVESISNYCLVMIISGISRSWAKVGAFLFCLPCWLFLLPIFFPQIKGAPS